MNDVAEARAHMLAHRHDRNDAQEIVEEEWVGPTWTETELKAYAERKNACVVLIDGYAVDVTGYMRTHVRSLSFRESKCVR